MPSPGTSCTRSQIDDDSSSFSSSRHSRSKESRSLSFWSGQRLSSIVVRCRSLSFAAVRCRSLRIQAAVVSAFCAHSALAQPAFVQANHGVQQASQTMATIPYLRAQMPGDLNVVVVGWKDTAVQISSVSDAAGNVYQLAIGPTPISGT